MPRPARYPIAIQCRVDQRTADTLRRGAREQGQILGVYVRQLVQRALAEQQATR